MLNGKKEKAEEKIKVSIAASSMVGFLQDKDRDLTHEPASTYFKAQGDDNWEKYHVERSKACYEEWGCSEKRLSSLRISLAMILI